MTKDEAIKIINEHIAIHRYNEPQAVRITEALQMAIKALEQVNLANTEVKYWKSIALEYLNR